MDDKFRSYIGRQIFVAITMLDDYVPHAPNADHDIVLADIRLTLAALMDDCHDIPERPERTKIMRQAVEKFMRDKRNVRVGQMLIRDINTWIEYHQRVSFRFDIAADYAGSRSEADALVQLQSDIRDNDEK